MAKETAAEKKLRLQLEANPDTCPECAAHLNWRVKGSWDAHRSTQCPCGFSWEHDDEKHEQHPQHPAVRALIDARDNHIHHTHVLLGPDDKAHRDAVAAQHAEHLAGQ